VEVERPFLLITLAVLLARLVLFGVGDTSLSIADTSVPGNEVASSEASNSSATAGIRTTMTGVVDE